MSTGFPGTVLFEGLLEGPTAAWSPDPALVAEALTARGLPADLLLVMIEGGRAMLQPQDHAYPRAQFAAEPSDALALALQDLLQEQTTATRDWFSSLRVISFAERTRVEALLHLGEEGVHVVRREQPWNPPPPVTLWTRLRKNWLILVVAGLGALAMAWLKRDALLDGWNYFYSGILGN